MTVLPSADNLDVRAALTLQDIIIQWGDYYLIEYNGGKYRATRPDGRELPEADTPEGIESAIRADYSRWGKR